LKYIWQEKLEKKVKDYLEDFSASHDFYHAKRVRDNALRITKQVKCDEEVLIAAALLHDTGYKGHDDHKHHFQYSIEIARKWLPEVDFPASKLDDVIEAIRLHDNFAWGHDGEKTDHIETKILQDADRIEALGAIGTARIAYYYGERGLPIITDKPVPESKEVFLDHSFLDALDRISVKDYENLNFPYSKKIAEKRYQFTKNFLIELQGELRSDDL